MRTTLTTLLAMTLAGPATAASVRPWSLQALIGNPERLSLHGNVRIRHESLAGQFRPGLGAGDQAWSLRTTLDAEYRAREFRVNAELIDSRLYGNDADSAAGTSEVNALELVQVNLQRDFANVIGRRSSLTAVAGRYTLDVGSRRLVARNDFRNTTNAFTGAYARWYNAAGWRALVFASLPQQRRPDDRAALLDNRVDVDREGFDQIFYGMTVTAPVGSSPGRLQIYGLGLDERDHGNRATADRELYTVGSRLLLRPAEGALDYELEAAHQFGSRSAGTASDAPSQPVAAHFAHLQIGYTIEAPWQPRLALAADLASGDRSDGGRNNRFDTLFGARRSEFGPTGLYGLLGRSNIRALESRFELQPSPRADAMFAWSASWLDARRDAFAASGVRDPSGASGRFAGHQLEARVRYTVLPSRLRLEMGGALFVSGAFFATAPNASGHGNTLYGYSQLVASF